MGDVGGWGGELLVSEGGARLDTVVNRRVDLNERARVARPVQCSWRVSHRVAAWVWCLLRFVSWIKVKGWNENQD